MFSILHYLVCFCLNRILNAVFVLVMDINLSTSSKTVHNLTSQVLEFNLLSLNVVEKQ